MTFASFVTSVAWTACPKNNLSCQTPSLSIAICRSERDMSCLIKLPLTLLFSKLMKTTRGLC